MTVGLWDEWTIPEPLAPGEWPISMHHLARDLLGRPVPWVAAWSSEVWGVARAAMDLPPFVAIRDEYGDPAPVALYCRGRHGRGHPVVDVLNEERQRWTSFMRCCPMCGVDLDGDLGGGFFAASALDEGHRFTTIDEDGTPVTLFPAQCRPCATWAAVNGPDRGEQGLVYVEQNSWGEVRVDPSVEPPPLGKPAPEDLDRLGAVARRQDPVGLLRYFEVRVERVQHLGLYDT